MVEELQLFFGDAITKIFEKISILDIITTTTLAYYITKDPRRASLASSPLSGCTVIYFIEN